MGAPVLLNLLNELGKTNSTHVRFYLSYDVKLFCKHVFGVKT